ncbi:MULTISPECIES: Tol-Pal system beta propeller repeat protein TolB [Candidatus Ichthyocystis]|uniref:Putative translocation protein TolB n=1 Tax=Candidatus Ichthyocystis hellenicum TaxID=1561003 RepID=A0A0S4M0Q4_9BURK|nr:MULTISPECIES: Tol-Pal system beta propeller repeat protein TolB [Ichthyocystis]CUT17310.1 putative translocation protein TolB [Candidatus Ichthyocystis hellenicum]
MRWFGIVCGLFLLVVPLSCFSQRVDIDISGGSKSRVNILLLPFRGVSSLARDPLDIVVDDLNDSGFFRVERIKNKSINDSVNAVVDASVWKSRGFDAVVNGRVVAIHPGHYELNFAVYDVNQTRYLVNNKLALSDNKLDKVAHLISDEIYKSFLGVNGYFNSKIAYITKKNGNYELHTADVNGKNDKTWVSLSEPLLSPKWSYGGDMLAFVSFERKKPVVKILHLADGTLSTLANYDGSNSSPAWSPDGSHVLVVLTKNGVSDIYALTASGTDLVPVIHSSSIDTEPVYSHDGKSVFFTSDRGGSPQIYRYTLSTKRTERVTFVGGYNVSPAVSSDGRYLAYVSRQEGRGYVVMLMDLSSGQFWSLTLGPNDESPSFSSNDQLIMYASNVGGKGTIHIVSLLGEERYEYKFFDSKVISPSWSSSSVVEQ